jgi:CSLREA domain-containing protein
MKSLVPIFGSIAMTLGCSAAPDGAERYLRPFAAATGCFRVDSTDDEPDGDPGDGRCATACNHKCTLRAAIEESNAEPGPSSIILPPGTYLLTLGGLTVSDSLDLLGGGTDSTIIDGNGDELLDHALHQTAGALALSDLTVQNGGAVNVGAGGDLLLEGERTTLTRVDVSGGRAFSAGGGIFNRGALTVVESTIHNNTVTSRGGGIFSTTPSTLTIDRSTLNANDSTLGGAIHSFGTLAIRNSTISGNRARAGTGGVINVGAGTLDNVTITLNMGAGGAGTAGGIDNAGALALTVGNSIIAGNLNPAFGGSPDCTNTLTSTGFNLIGDLTGCTVDGDTTGDLTGVDARLGPLAPNGGPTRTHALLAGSPALDAGSPADAGAPGACQPIDQRDVTRPQGPRCDIGAFELIP